MDKHRFSHISLLVFFLASFAIQAQNLPPMVPANYLFEKWDDLNQRLIFHRTILKPATPDIYVADMEGRQTLAINVLKDFPGALNGTVGMNNIAGGTDGGVALFCLLDYGVRPLKQLILTYGASGKLIRTIDAGPFAAAALTVDDQGNTYIFTSNSLYDVDDPKAVYPTVVKYDLNGQIAKTMLPSSNFPVGEYPTDRSEQNGEPLLRVTSKGIVVFAAFTGTWFLLTQHGEIVAQRDLSPVIRKVATDYKFKRGVVNRSFLDAAGWPVVYMRLDDSPFDESNVPPPDKMRLKMPLLKIDPYALSFVDITTEIQHGVGRLEGFDNDGSPAFAHVKADGSLRIERLSSSKPD